MADNTKVLALILLVALAFVGMSFLGSVTGVALPGGTTLSISNVQIVSNDPTINGKAIIWTAVADNTGESGSATISPSAFNSTERPTNSFDVGLQLQSYGCNYPIQETNDVVYKYVIKQSPAREGCPSSGSCWWSCPPAYPDATYVYVAATYSSSAVCNYIIKEPIYRIGFISTTPVYDYSVKASVVNGGNTISGVITPQVSTTTLTDSSGAILGKAKFAGNVLGNIGCPSPSSDTIAMRPVNTNNYKATGLPYYNNWITFKISTEANLNQDMSTCIHKDCSYCGTSYMHCESTVESTIATYNTQVDTLYNSKPPISNLCPFNVVTNQTPIYACTPVTPAILPMVQFIVKADYFSLYIPSSKPKITAFQSTPILEGGMNNYHVKVKNIGDVTDAFKLEVDCPVQINFFSDQISLDPGEEKETVLKVQGLPSTQSCTLMAYSANNIKNNDTQQVTLEFIKLPCPHSCCLADSTYQEKKCPPTVSYTHTEYKYVPGEWGCASDNTSQRVACCTNLTSRCWSAYDVVETFPLYCNNEFTCVAQGLPTGNATTPTLPGENVSPPIPTYSNLSAAGPENYSMEQAGVPGQDLLSNPTNVVAGLVILGAAGYLIMQSRK
jgi:hypothetical protein